MHEPGTISARGRVRVGKQSRSYGFATASAPAESAHGPSDFPHFGAPQPGSHPYLRGFGHNSGMSERTGKMSNERRGRLNYSVSDSRVWGNRGNYG